MPMDKPRYPDDWDAISRQVRDRAKRPAAESGAKVVALRRYSTARANSCL